MAAIPETVLFLRLLETSQNDAFRSDAEAPIPVPALTTSRYSSNGVVSAAFVGMDTATPSSVPQVNA